MKNKLSNRSGETIVEALISIIIAVISIALLVTSITAASKVNAAAKAELTEKLAFHYSELSSKDVQVQISFSDTNLNDINDESNTVNAVLSENNGYKFYKK